CGSGCRRFERGAMVTLTAVDGQGSLFRSWSGACTGNRRTCTLTMTADRTVTATFDLVHRLEVGKTGLGSGTVTSSPQGIRCGADCSKDYPDGTRVVLVAQADAASKFVGWAGCDLVSNN